MTSFGLFLGVFWSGRPTNLDGHKLRALHSGSNSIWGMVWRSCASLLSKHTEQSSSGYIQPSWRSGVQKAHGQMVIKYIMQGNTLSGRSLHASGVPGNWRTLWAVSYPNTYALVVGWPHVGDHMPNHKFCYYSAHGWNHFINISHVRFIWVTFFRDNTIEPRSSLNQFHIRLIIQRLGRFAVIQRTIICTIRMLIKQWI